MPTSHPNHGTPCDKIILYDWATPRIVFRNRRPPSQLLGVIYEIANVPWPPDDNPEVLTGFYRRESNGSKTVHSVKTPARHDGIQIEERWECVHDPELDLAETEMIGFYDCNGDFILQRSQPFYGRVFDAEATITGTGGVTEEVSGTFADMFDDNNTRIVIIELSGDERIFGFALYSSGECDHFLGMLTVRAVEV